MANSYIYSHPFYAGRVNHVLPPKPARPGAPIKANNSKTPVVSTAPIVTLHNDIAPRLGAEVNPKMQNKISVGIVGYE
jgi:hypothetical protein